MTRWAHRVLYTDGRRDFTHPHAHIEFNLVYEGWKHAREHRASPDEYRYLLRTRTDLVTTIPFSLKAIYEPTEEDIRVFAEAYDAGCPEAKRSRRDMMLSFLMCAGRPEYAHRLENFSPHCYIHPLAWNQEKLYRWIDTYTNNDNVENASSILARVQEQHQTNYLIGSTWLHFGPWAQQEQMVEKSTASFGQLSFQTFGFPDTSLLTTFPATIHRITEAQLRLAHFHLGLGMVDIFYRPDYNATFKYPRPRSLEEMQRLASEKHYNFLSRLFHE